MTKKALLVGSSFSSAPIFFELKKRGLHVSVCGNNKSDPCHQYADASFFFDYSEKEELLKLIESENFDFLVPTCNDYSYMSCTWVADKVSFPGFDSLEVADILHTKSSFREFTNQYSMPAPKSIEIELVRDIDFAGFKFPILVKPVDSFSGRGVTKVLGSDSLEAAIVDAAGNSRSGEIVIEEFVEGGLHSHSAFIQDKKIVFDVFVDEFCTIYPYQVNCSNHPSMLTKKIQDLFRKSILQLVENLNLGNGLLHTQFIANGDEFWIVECMRRGPGDLYGSLVEYSTGINYTDLYVRPFLYEALPQDLILREPKFYGRHTISSTKPLVNFTFTNEIPSKSIKVVPLKSSGEKLDVAPYDKLAILFAEYNNGKEMLEVSPKLDSYVSISSLDIN